MRLPRHAMRPLAGRCLPALAALALLACAPAAALARENLRFDPAALGACVEGGGGGDCIGQAADACMAATEGGYSNRGMIACIAAELAWWEAGLDASYKELHTREQKLDSELSEGIAGMPPRPSGADSLRDLQRAWTVYRDASCDYEALDWWGGTGAGLMIVSCRLQMTADQALQLRDYLTERMGDD